MAGSTACFDFSSPSGGGTTPDAATEAASADVGAPDVSSADAQATDAANPFFCRTVSASFCEDFDEGPLPGQWDGLADMGGSLGLDSADSFSRPNSLLARYEAQSSTTGSTLQKTFSRQTPPSQLDLDFRFFPAAVAASGVAVVASVEYFDPAQSGIRYDVQFTLESDLNLRIDEEGATADGGELYMPHEPRAALPPTAWTDVHLSIASGANGPVSAQVTYGGVTSIDVSLTAPFSSSANATNVTLTLGGLYVAPNTAWTVRFDNVVLNLQ